jgi:AraC-like DNA-binding protein
MNWNEPKNKTAPEKAREIVEDKRARPDATAREIARRHGVAPTTVARILREAGLLAPAKARPVVRAARESEARRCPSHRQAEIEARAAERRARILALAEEHPGWTALRIAQVVHVSASLVQLVLRKAGKAGKWGAREGNDNGCKKADRLARNDAERGLDDEVTPEEARWAVVEYQSRLRSPEALARDLGVKLRPLCRAMKALGCVLGFDDPDAALKPAPGHAAARRMRRAVAGWDSYHICGAIMP